jgi:hypothetical protein
MLLNTKRERWSEALSEKDCVKYMPLRAWSDQCSERKSIVGGNLKIATVLKINYI